MPLLLQSERRGNKPVQGMHQAGGIITASVSASSVFGSWMNKSVGTGTSVAEGSRSIEVNASSRSGTNDSREKRGKALERIRIQFAGRPAA